MTKIKTEPASASVHLELINTLYRQSPPIFLGNLAVVTLSIFLWWSEVSRPALLMWAGAIYVLTLVRIAMVWSDRREAVHPLATAHYRGWRFVLLSGLSGCLWGSIGVVFFAPDSTIVTVYICIVLAGMTGGSVASLSAFRPAYLAYALPTVLPFAVRCFIQGNSLFTVLGVLSLCILAINLSYSGIMQRTVRDSVALRFENIDLIRQLTEEKERAESANRSKSQFLAAASHDLRQPTHALGLYIATLRAMAQAPHIDPAGIVDLAQRLQTALMGMSQLLNVLLDISRLDAGVIQVTESSFALQSRLDALENQFAQAAAAKGLTLKILPSAIRLETDPVLLQNILSNLLSNAVRYTARGGVLLACRRRKADTDRGDEIEIRIVDTGVGIAPEQCSNIFREFYQVDNIARDREQGLGLGLAIVQRTAELLGARITLRSTPGKGSRFSVFLPVKAMHDAAALPAIADTRDAAAPHGQTKTVLVIEDDKQVLDSMALLLRTWGLRVIAARSREQALAAVSSDGDVPDLVLTDFWLAAGVTGIDAIHAVFQRTGRTMPAIIITGDTSAEGIYVAMRSGFQVLHKPLNPEEMRAALMAKLAD
jgi:signal transduction histidine kinase/ActR/RegA family two-component response regulator